MWQNAGPGLHCTTRIWLLLVLLSVMMNILPAMHQKLGLLSSLRSACQPAPEQTQAAVAACLLSCLPNHKLRGLSMPLAPRPLLLWRCRILGDDFSGAAFLAYSQVSEPEPSESCVPSEDESLQALMLPPGLSQLAWLEGLTIDFSEKWRLLPGPLMGGIPAEWGLPGAFPRLKR